jgi:hypothetical protein
MTTLTWVGGTGTWNTTNTAVWSPAQVPTAADDVVFSSASTYTVTMTGALLCRDITVSAGTVTFATGTAPTLAISGSMSLVTGTIWSMSGTITFNATTTGKTIATNGVSLAANLVFNGVGGYWTLTTALTGGSNSTVTVTNGTFDTGNFNVTNAALFSSNSNVRTIKLGSSVLSLSSGVALSFTTTTNLTFDAGTSTINLTGQGQTINGGVTYYNVNFTGSNLNGHTISGSNTFNNNLSFTYGGTVSPVTFGGNQVINGTLSCGTTPNAVTRTFFRSDVIGTQRTLTCAAITSPTDVDFRDIAISGAVISGGNLTGTRLGDCKGNSGITFPAAKTVYWNSSGGGNWSSNGWATTGGGTPATVNFPLAQDTAIFQSTGLNSAATVTINSNYNIGTIDMSARTTNTMTLATGTTTPAIYGNWVNGTGTTLSGTGTITFAGRGSQTITSAGKTFTQVLTVNSPGWSVALADAYTSSVSFTLTAGTFDLSNNNCTISGFTTAGSISRTLAIGLGLLTVTGSGSTWTVSSAVNFTVTGSGIISMTGASAKTFLGGSISYSGITLNQGGAGALTINGSNTFGNLTATTLPSTITITSGTTQTFQNFTLSGTSGSLVIVAPSSTSTYNFVKSGGGTVNVSYLSISYCAATPGSTWYMTNSTDGGNNSGITFSGSLVSARSFGWIIT